MTKRANDQCAGSGDEDRRNEFTVLPFDVLRLIGEALRVDSLEDRPTATALTSFALASRALYDIFVCAVKYCGPHTWCVLCGTSQGTVSADGCRHGNHCAVYVTLLDLKKESTPFDRLCKHCCRQSCSLCRRGHCGCDDDFTMCSLCKRGICGDCRYNEDMCRYDEDYDGFVCNRCDYLAQHGLPVGDSYSEEEEEERVENSQ